MGHPSVNADWCIPGRERRSGFATQYRTVVAIRGIAAHPPGGGTAREVPRPPEDTRFFHRGKPDSLPLPLEGGDQDRRRLLVVFLVKFRALGAPFQAVEQGLVPMTNTLLQRYARSFIEPPGFRLSFQRGQRPSQPIALSALPVGVIGVRLEAPPPIVDIANPSAGSGQHVRLLVDWVDATFVGSLYHGIPTFP